MKIKSSWLMISFFIILAIRVFAVTSSNQSSAETSNGCYFKSGIDKDNCIYDLATQTNNFSICNQAGNSASSCYSQIALNLKDPSICFNYQNASNCFKEYSEKSNLNKICREKGNSYSIAVLACFYEELKIPKNTIDINDLSICTLSDAFVASGDQDRKDMCIASIGAYLQDTTICNQADKYKGDCYIVISRTNLQFSLADCDKAGTDYTGCYIAFAVRNNDLSVCDKVPISSKEDCMAQVAIKQQNLSICTQLKDGSQASFCAQQIIPKLVENGYNYQFCDNIDKLRQNGFGTSINTNQCFYDVGTKTLNLKACDRITNDDNGKNDCITRVQHVLSN